MGLYWETLLRVSTHWETRHWDITQRKFKVQISLFKGQTSLFTVHTSLFKVPTSLSTVQTSLNKLQLSVQSLIPNFPGKLSLVPTTRSLHCLGWRHWVLCYQVFQDK